MKLDDNEYKVFLDLKKKVKDGSATDVEKAKFKELETKRNGDHGSKGKEYVTNDPEWYKKYPALFENATKVAFASQVGNPIQVGNSYINIPAVNRFEVLQTPGMLNSQRSGYNWQIIQLWLDMHRKYRGMGGYQAADLGCAMFAIVDFFANISRAERIYGALYQYNALNKSMPKQLLHALRIDDNPTLLRGEYIAGFRYDINKLIAATEKLLLPRGFSAMEAYFNQLAFVYKDADSKRATLSVFDTPYYCKWSPTYVTTGSAVRYVKRKSSGITQDAYGDYLSTLQDVIDDLYSQLDALINDTDVQRMCSDILAAYKDSGVYQLQPLPEDYKLTLVKDDFKTLQIHNATFHGTLYGCEFVDGLESELLDSTTRRIENSLTIYQSNNVLYQSVGAVFSDEPVVRAALGSSPIPSQQVTGTNVAIAYMPSINGGEEQIPVVLNNAFIDTWNDEPTPDEVIEMTRIHSVGRIDDVFDANGNYIGTRQKVTAYGLFIGMKMTVFTTETPDIASNEYIVKATSFAPYAVLNSTLLKRFCNALKTDWAPFFYLLYNVTSTSGGITVFGDIVNPINVSESLLFNMHDNVALSVWKNDVVTTTD